MALANSTLATPSLAGATFGGHLVTGTRCAAKSKRSGERCKNPAVTGARGCKIHLGRRLADVKAEVQVRRGAEKELARNGFEPVNDPLTGSPGYVLISTTPRTFWVAADINQSAPDSLSKLDGSNIFDEEFRRFRAITYWNDGRNCRASERRQIDIAQFSRKESRGDRFSSAGHHAG